MYKKTFYFVIVILSTIKYEHIFKNFKLNLK